MILLDLLCWITHTTSAKLICCKPVLQGARVIK
jgi:hypothetical protein